MKRRAARKTTTKAKPPAKRAKTTVLSSSFHASQVQEEVQELVTFSSRVIQTDGQPAKMVNWLADEQVVVEASGLSFSNSGYQFGSTKANVGVCKGVKCTNSFDTPGLWYYEVTLSSNTSARVGWATNAFKPANK
jgi:hypothetical protein